VTWPLRWALAVIGLWRWPVSILLPVGHPALGTLSGHADAAARPGRLDRHTFTDIGLPLLFTVGVLTTGALVTVYNFLGFRLLRSPFDLPASIVGLVFVVYLPVRSPRPLPRAVVDRFGRQRLVWPAAAVMLAGVLLLRPDDLVTVVIGLIVLTSGFFAVHSHGQQLGRRPVGRAAGAGLGRLLCAFYLGSSVGGSLGGLAFGAGGWAV